MSEQNATDSVARRNVLKTAGGFLAGSTVFANLGTGRGATGTEVGLQVEVLSVTEEAISTRVTLPNDAPDRSNNIGFLADHVFLGRANRFVIHEDEGAVSLPENPEEVLANPVEMERVDEKIYRMHFRTQQLNLSDGEDREGGPLGLGFFPERTIPTRYFESLRRFGGLRHTPTTTSTPTRPMPENGKLKFAHFTPFAVCSIELENVATGRTIELLDLPNTHDKLKPRTYFSYASGDYPQIKSNAIYKLTATTCDGNHSATNWRFNFSRGGVWTINNW